MQTQHDSPEQMAVQEGFIRVENGEIYTRQTGQGQPLIVLHGGPDFNHSYLLPDMDRLADAYRLIYYDQRGRGRSASGVQPEQVSLASEMADLEAVRDHFRLERAAILGHSWGGLLAMEYASRYPSHVSHLVLLNPAPASHDDYLLQQERLKEAAEDIKKRKAISATAGYRTGDLDTNAEIYRLHFRTTLRRAEQLEKVVKSLQADFTPESLRKAREIEERLMQETWLAEGYDLFPRLQQLDVPALVIHSEYDLIPAACAAHIAEAIPRARFAWLQDCGHFSFLECPEAVRKEVDIFFSNTEGRRLL